MVLKVVVFDLDYTLWPYFADCNIKFPLKKDLSGKVFDKHAREVKIYDEVPLVLEYLQKNGFILAIASKNPDVKAITQLLELFELDRYFPYREMYFTSKKVHFKRLKAAIGVDFSEMLFFDDDPANKYDLQTLGVHTIVVREGLTMQVLKDGLAEHKETYKYN